MGEAGITNHLIEAFVSREALYPNERGPDALVSEFTPLDLHTVIDGLLILASGTLVNIVIHLFEWGRIGCGSLLD